MSASNNSYPTKWHRRVLPGSIQAYVFSTFCVALSSLLHLGLGLISEDSQVFTTYYPAVLFATLVGGRGAGIYAALLSGLIAWWAFMPPYFAFSPLTLGQATSLLIYLFASLLIVWAADHYRNLTRRFEDEEKFRKLTVEELSHRLKNKIATIQAIISLELHDIPEKRAAIMGRLVALAATDDLILEAQGQGARLREILSTELGPYQTSQIAIAGPVILLSPKLALTMALLIHELATNAAKYGALSSAAGQVAINWSLSDGHLKLEWRESGGPVVKTPTQKGFGMRLLSQALTQFGGVVETRYEATGLFCKMNIPLPKNPALGPGDTTSGEEIVSYG